MLPVWDRVAGGADVAYIYSGPWSGRDPVSSRRRGEDPPGCDPRPEAQKGRKAHVIQMTVKEHKTGTSRVQEKGPGRFFFYGRMASFLDTAPIFDYYNAVTLLTIWLHKKRNCALLF